MKLAVVGVVLSVCILQVYGDALHWTYTGELGPAGWAKLFPKCGGGKKQSPIDIQTSAVKYDPSLTPFVFHGYDKLDHKAIIKNNGHSVEIDLMKNRYAISGGGLPTTYKAAQFHFHWADEDSKGSEHTLDGKTYPLELHIVHYSDKYRSLSEAASQPDGLAVLGFFFEVAAMDNYGYQTIVDDIDDIIYEYEVEPVGTMKLRDLLSDDLSKFYRYSGSLTTPACHESVIWTIFKDTIKISDAQLAHFRTLLINEPHEASKTMNNNYRPVQPLNGRTVYSNDKASPAGTRASGEL